MGCEGKSETIRPLWIEKDFDSKAEALSAINALDKICFLPVDVLADERLVLQRTNYIGENRPGTARFGGPAIGDITWGYRVQIDYKTHKCLRFKLPWNSLTPEDLALYRAQREKVRGRFDRALWQGLQVDLTIPSVVIQ